MDIAIKKDAKYYMGLHYNMWIKYREEQGGYYVAGFVELPDLTMVGKTPQEAIKDLLDEKEEWFEGCLRNGIEIPEPLPEVKYSGKVNFRMPRQLHQTISTLAEYQGVSLNQYILSAVSKFAGMTEVNLTIGKSLRRPRLTGHVHIVKGESRPIRHLIARSRKSKIEA
jgi:predicted HicB family RNase H-like nuclease